MKKINRRSFLAAAGLTAAALALTACGGSASSTASSTASSAASSEAASTSAAAELTTVEAGKLTMATNAAFPPYEMTTDAGEFEGIDIDTAKAIAEKLGLELQIDDMDFDAALLSVQQGKADIVMAGVTVTDERKAVMDFSDSYATGIQSIIVPEGSDITSPDDLAGKKIGTQRGTTGYIYCSDDFGDDAVVAYDDGLTAVQALNNGQVDAVVIDNAPAKEFVAANPGLVILDTSYAEEDYAIGMAKGSALEDAVNKALEELKADGDPLEQKAIGRDALVFIVNEDNPVQSLTLQQLKDIYAGTITNWKDVGGKDQEIIAFQRRADSGSQTLFQKLLIQGGPLMEAPTELAPTAMGELVDSIAEYNNSANAIGFSVYYYIDQMYSQPGLRLLAVDGVTPSNDTIASESYPLCNEFYAVLHADAAADSPERQLYDWLDTAAGQDCIKKSGYVAVAPATAANSAV